MELKDYLKHKVGGENGKVVLLNYDETKKPNIQELEEIFKNIEIEKNGEDNTRPKHYLGKSGKQVFEVLEDFLPNEYVKGFYLGNVIKYVLRHKNKNGVEDLEKAREYLDKLIEKEKMKND